MGAVIMAQSKTCCPLLHQLLTTSLTFEGMRDAIKLVKDVPLLLDLIRGVLPPRILSRSEPRLRINTPTLVCAPVWSNESQRSFGALRVPSRNADEVEGD